MFTGEIQNLILSLSYVLPAINGFEGNMAKPFAQILCDNWNEKFGTNMEVGDYDRTQYALG